MVFDSWAGELSPASFRIFSLPFLKYICDNLPKRLNEMKLPRVPMTVFAKGAWYALDDLVETQYNVIGLDWLHDPAQAYKIAQAKGKVVQGNMDPGVLYGSKESIATAVSEMVKGFGGGKQGWITNLGHGKKCRPGDCFRLLMFTQRCHAIHRSGEAAIFLRADPRADQGRIALNSQS